MTLATVFTKTIRDRWLGFTIGGVLIGLLFIAGMSVYGTIDLDIYRSMPEVFRSLVGISADADLASLSYAAIYGFIGALTLAALALTVGSSSIAGEERSGTLGLLLANPKSRTHVLLSKAGAMLVLTAFGALILLVAAYVVPAILDVSIAGMEPGALIAHIFAHALFIGLLAMAVGAWTGSSGAATGVAAGVLLISYLATGLLPLFEGWEGLTRIFPWYYLDGSAPELNGIDWGHLAVFGVASLILLGIAVVGVNRRDIKGRSVGRGMIDRLREAPGASLVVDRLAGSVAVSSVWLKTVAEHQGLALAGGVLMVALGAMMGPIYTFLPVELRNLGDQLPEALLALVGNGDFSTAAGWYQLENFSLMAPTAVMVVAITLGARALAGEEGNRTMGLLLANPISRTSVLIQKAGAMVLLVAIVGVLTFVGTWIGVTISGLEMDLGGAAAASLLVSLLGLAFGGLALLLSAATGRVRIAVMGTLGVLMVAYFANSFLPLSADVADLARLSPFYYYLGGDPLVAGLDPVHAVVLGSIFIVEVVVGVILFKGRDLRTTI